MRDDDSANHDDSTATDDGKTAMQRYAAWHRENCRCEPADTNDTNDTNDAHDADTVQDADTDAAETWRDSGEDIA
ncbi:MAG: hypothetical protein ABSD52_13900 [Candidatus Cybelea sp.]|jgi:hypothetical protein